LFEVSRLVALEGADAVVFVADTQSERLEASTETFEYLETHLAVHGRGLDTVPLVLQYNKRDLPGVSSVEELDRVFAAPGRPRFEAVAPQGIGVFDTFKAAVKLVLHAASKPA
jgi:hypothetical protein